MRFTVIRGAELFNLPYAITWTMKHARTIMEVTRLISLDKLHSEGNWWRENLPAFLDDREQMEKFVNAFWDQYAANTVSEPNQLQRGYKIYPSDVLLTVEGVTVSRESFYRLQRVGQLQVDIVYCYESYIYNIHI